MHILTKYILVNLKRRLSPWLWILISVIILANFLSLCIDSISNCLEVDSKVNEIILSISSGQIGILSSLRFKSK